jgi:hypothetical protein
MAKAMRALLFSVWVLWVLGAQLRVTSGKLQERAAVIRLFLAA